VTYGEAPVDIGAFDLPWEEFMHYLYLPVRLRATVSEQQGIQIPARLEMVRPLVRAALADARVNGYTNPYVYVTARRGVATPDNPLNRPGWHTDGFGTFDRNYIWWDRFPTRFAQGPFTDISHDHLASMAQFEEQAPKGLVFTFPDRHLYRLTPYVVHTTPRVDEMGERSFLKISISNHRYNLKGNSHNYLLDYDWEMFARSDLRNDPARAGLDYLNPEGTS
jgi:hypothetical protein